MLYTRLRSLSLRLSQGWVVKQSGTARLAACQLQCPFPENICSVQTYKAPLAKSFVCIACCSTQFCIASWATTPQGHALHLQVLRSATQVCIGLSPSHVQVPCLQQGPEQTGQERMV